MPEPDFVKRRDSLLEAIDKKGVPGKLARAMMRPGTLLEDWSIDGVAGVCPTARQATLTSAPTLNPPPKPHPTLIPTLNLT